MSNVLNNSSIKIGGVDYWIEDSANAIRLSLSQGIAQHHNLSIVFRRDVFETSNKLVAKSSGLLGEKIHVKIDTRDADTDKIDTFEFKGVVTGINSSKVSGSHEGSISVTASSPDLMLDDGSHAQSFSEKKLEEIVKSTLSDYNEDFRIKLDESNTEKAYIVQYKETNYGFLSRLASKYGCWFYYNGKELIFEEKPNSSNKDTIDLITEETLYDFSLQLKVQPFKFGFTSYDYTSDAKQKFEANDKQPGISMSDTAKLVESASNNLFTHQSTIPYNNPLTAKQQQKHLEDRIKIKKSGKAANMVICSGSSDCPALVPGVFISIKENIIGQKKPIEHGEFVVVEVSHSLSGMGEYSNNFTAIPKECDCPYNANPHNIPLCETQSAFVVENEDPDNMGRVRVRFIWQPAEEMTPWIRIVNPYAGKDKGHIFVPEIDEEVLVAFEGGNAEKPYVLGSLYHAKAYPETWTPNKNNDIKAIRTRSGHTIEFRDTEGEEEVWMYDHNKENYFIKLKSHAKEITIEAVEHIELKAKNISIKAEKDLKIESTDTTAEASGNITEKASGNISSQASGNMKLKAGANANIEAGGQLLEKASIIKQN